jgi:hypothetical protein
MNLGFVSTENNLRIVYVVQVCIRRDNSTPYIALVDQCELAAAKCLVEIVEVLRGIIPCSIEIHNTQKALINENPYVTISSGDSSTTALDTTCKVKYGQ